MMNFFRKKKILGLIMFMIIAVLACPVSAFGADSEGVKVYSSKTVPSRTGSWSGWSKVRPSADFYDQVQTKIVYRYKDKEYVSSTEDSLTGYKFNNKKILDRTYSDQWDRKKGESSSKVVISGANAPYVEVTDYETKAVHYSFTYHCKCCGWYWVNKGGHHEDLCTYPKEQENDALWAYTTELLEVYSEQDITETLIFDNDGKDKPGYWCGGLDFNKYPERNNTISVGDDPTMGRIFLIYDSGKSVNSFATMSPKNKAFLYGLEQEDATPENMKTVMKDIFREYKERYVNVFYKWGAWSTYRFTKPADKAGRQIEAVKVYRCRNVKFSKYRPVVKLKKLTSSSIRIEWSKVPYADRYKIYLYDYKYKKYRLAAVKDSIVKATVHKHLKKGRTYKYKVKAYRIKNGVKQNSSYSYAKKIAL